MTLADSLTHSITFSFVDPLYVDRFGRSLRFCHQEFVKEAIYDGYWSENGGGGG